jgi:hypothetical protein
VKGQQKLQEPDRHLAAVPDTPEPLMVVNTETGEQIAPLEHYRQEAEAEYNALQGKFRAALAEITKLKRDAEADARAHELYAEAETLHSWWRLACGHPGVTFKADDFYVVLPRLKERDVGPIGVLKAICGAAFDPGTKAMKNGRLQVFNDWELINRSQSKWRSFAERVPGDPDGPEWRRWLVRHIESQFV